MFENDWIDHDYIKENTVGVEDLKKVVKKYEPAYVQEITGVAQEDLQEGRRNFGKDGETSFYSSARSVSKLAKH